MSEKEKSIMDLNKYIADVKDFPIEGILFKDITQHIKDLNKITNSISN